ncbi:MAG: hypothetical protein CM15mP46_6930 [Alphaproteobacteria bacterium]|nr:MAG: hypothetical protein CM15mP46_6930 [Alphaproteobacteria bacterium]
MQTNDAVGPEIKHNRAATVPETAVANAKPTCPKMGISDKDRHINRHVINDIFTPHWLAGVEMPFAKFSP